MNLVLILGTLGLSAAALHLFVFGCLWRQLRRPIPQGTHGPRLAVLRPLKGEDAGLVENLVALYEQDYENFEVFIGVEDADDPALAIARKVASAYPDRVTRLVVTGPSSGLNPKVRTLRKLEEFVSAELILVSDSNVRPSRGYLSALIAEQTSQNADLVHSLLLGDVGRGLGGNLEDLHMSGWVAGSVAFTTYGGHPCVIGKSMLMRREALEKVGGFRGVANHLAEDYILGARFSTAGFKVTLSNYPLRVVNAGAGVGAFWRRHVRWGQMRRHINPVSYSAELLSNPTPFLLGAILLDKGVLSWGFGAALLLKWSAESAIVLRFKGTERFEKGWSFALLPLRDLLLVPIWLTALFRRDVEWRGNRMRVTAGSVLVELPSSREIHDRPAIGFGEQLQS